MFYIRYTFRCFLILAVDDDEVSKFKLEMTSIAYSDVIWLERNRAVQILLKCSKISETIIIKQNSLFAVKLTGTSFYNSMTIL